MTDDNILSKIPGEILGSADYSLPPADSSTENVQRLVVRLPDGTHAEVTFVSARARRVGPRAGSGCRSATLIETKAPLEQIKPCPIAQHDWQSAGVVRAGWPREMVQEMLCKKYKARRLLTDSDEDVQRMYAKTDDR